MEECIVPEFLQDKEEFKYELVSYLGKGGFGKIYNAICKETGKHAIVKIEEHDEKNPQLKNEFSIYQELHLQGVPNGVNIPQTFHFFAFGEYNVMAMQKLGASLKRVREEYSSKCVPFSVVKKIAVSLIKSFEYIHGLGYVHRDVKPDNFIKSENDEDDDTVFTIDFGLSKKYIDDEGNHLPFKSGGRMVGTANFASLNVHKGHRYSRRDDLESLAYVLVWLLMGKLPWNSIKGKNMDNKIKEIESMKETLSPAKICKDCPKEISILLKYARKLKYEDEPKYSKLVDIFEGEGLVEN